MDTEAVYFLDLQTSLEKESLNGLSLRMFQGSLMPTVEKISEQSSPRWMNSGMAFRGEYSMQSSLEHPSVVVESSLSEVLEASAPLTYFLTIKQIESLLQRSADRNKKLPRDLDEAYRSQIHILSNMLVSDATMQQDLRPKDTETMEKLTHSTPGVQAMLFVRRLLPSEYERLQGFPPNWTAIDTEQ